MSASGLSRGHVCALAALLLAAAGADARQCKGVVFPGQIHVHGTVLKLNGVGLRTATLFGISVYVAALYVVKPSADAHAIMASSGPIQVTMQFVRGLWGWQIRNGWAEGLAKQVTSEQLATLKGPLATLDRWTPDVKAGQRMTFTRIPGQGLTVAVDGVVKGTIPGDDFSRAFLLIWLGVPPTPAVKSGMLGGACG